MLKELKSIKIENYTSRKNLYTISYSTNDSLVFYKTIYSKNPQLFLRRKTENFQQGMVLRNKIQTISSQESGASN